MITITPCANIKELTLGCNLPIFAESKCTRALEDAAQLLNIACLRRERYAALRMLALEITFDANTFRNVSDPNENWVARVRGRDALETALAEAVKHCELHGVYIEPAADGEIDLGEAVARMFPLLIEKGQLFLRAPRDSIWQSQ